MLLWEKPLELLGKLKFPDNFENIRLLLNAIFCILLSSAEFNPDSRFTKEDCELPIKKKCVKCFKNLNCLIIIAMKK